ncbi:MAG: 7-carboxy-7-deazaguanine synthase QueE [Prochlorococcus sp. SP3034]|nr:7-carboxy-7-deazaguanine synthase QueE [Prochlorococcus sp. SP3034]|tara:strand:+ start:7359 stop:8015 length:657 start_codon:yes stop_codon:yes gene_type:complete
MTKFLPVVEKFHSLQGEGFHSGKSAFFIRLAGCKVGCSWCDTKQSWDSSQFPLFSIKSLLNEIIEAKIQGAAFIVLTGGEPLQHNLNDFCKIIKNKNKLDKENPIKIHIETSGVNEISGSYDWITLSPKRHKPPKEYFLSQSNEIKIIINDKKDIEFANEIMKKVISIEKRSNIFNKKNFFVQPAWENKKGFALAIEFAKMNPNWSLSLQTHKYLRIQ